MPWLEKAAAKYKLGPKGFSIVAAIHYIESDFGTSPLPGVAPGTQNSAGAEGPGQFLVSSWVAYGVDADGDGRKDPYSIPDSIFATANLLHADGAPKDWRGAIFDYVGLDRTQKADSRSSRRPVSLWGVFERRATKGQRAGGLLLRMSKCERVARLRLSGLRRLSDAGVGVADSDLAFARRASRFVLDTGCASCDASASLHDRRA